MEFLDKHQKVALLFSAGKDSAACLWLLEEFWPRLTVLWCNAGNAYPETYAYMERVKRLVPNFVEVRGRQPDWVRENGYPVDFVPVSSILMREKGLVPFSACCSANLWEPAFAYLVNNGFTGVIRGQKKADGLRAPEGKQGPLEFFHPLEDWTDEQVFEFLGDRVPESYKRGIPSSLDCMDCTAFAQESKPRIVELAKEFPLVYRKVQEIYGLQRGRLQNALESLNG